MNLKNLLKEKLSKDVLNAFKGDWSVFIYDESAAKIIKSIFTKTELLNYNFTSICRVEEERPNLDFPALYFVAANSEISSIINNDFSSKCLF